MSTAQALAQKIPRLNTNWTRPCTVSRPCQVISDLACLLGSWPRSIYWPRKCFDLLTLTQPWPSLHWIVFVGVRNVVLFRLPRKGVSYEDTIPHGQNCPTYIWEPAAQSTTQTTSGDKSIASRKIRSAADKCSIYNNKPLLPGKAWQFTAGRSRIWMNTSDSAIPPPPRPLHPNTGHAMALLACWHADALFHNLNYSLDFWRHIKAPF